MRAASADAPGGEPSKLRSTADACGAASAALGAAAAGAVEVPSASSVSADALSHLADDACPMPDLAAYFRGLPFAPLGSSDTAGASTLGKRADARPLRRSPPKRRPVEIESVLAGSAREFDAFAGAAREVYHRGPAVGELSERAPAPAESSASVAASLPPQAAAFLTGRFGSGVPIRRLADQRRHFSHRLPRIREFERRHYANSEKRKNLPSAVKYWIELLVGEARVNPLRPECPTLPEDEQEAEFELMEMYADFLFHDKGLRANTVENYLSLVRGWHIEETGWEPGFHPNRPNRRLARLITGFYRERPRRAPERHAHSAALFIKFRAPIQPFIDAIEVSEFGNSVDSIPASLRHSLEQLRLQLSVRRQWDRFMVCAALELQLCCLARPGELYPVAPRFTANDISFEFEGGNLSKATAMILPEKKRARSIGFNIKIAVPLLVDQGPNLQALKLVAILALFHLSDGRNPDTTPFFSFPIGGPRAGKALSFKFVKDEYLSMLREARVPCPELYNFDHVPRIIGGTALAAANFSPVILRAMGRWDGDIAFIYTRASREILERAQKALGSSDAGSLAAELIEAVSRLEDEPADGADDDDGVDVESADV